MNFIIYILRYYLYLLLFFLLSKLFFLFINSQNLGTDLLNFPILWWHGLQLDLSFASYILVIPILLHIFFYSKKWYSQGLKIYFNVVFVLLIVLSATDPFFYLYWGNKVNLFFVQFLDEGAAGFLSVAWHHYVLGLAFGLFCFWVYKTFWRNWLIPAYNSKAIYFIPALVFIAFLGRGGFSISPLSVSSAYYSDNSLYNNAAVNAQWNFCAYELDRSKNSMAHFMDDTEADVLFAELRKNEQQAFDTLVYDRNTRIVFVLMESFTSKISAYFSSSGKGYTPNLDRLAKEGIAYKNAYASSFRSDKGLTALMIGMPGLAKQTLTNMPNQIEAQPNLIRYFKEAGWKTSFFHGGDLNFANMRILLQDANLIVEQDAFKGAAQNTWGAHDEYVFTQFAEYVLTSETPSFNMMFSLSSHEPFKVPNYHRYKDPYLNSISYADSCLGAFINTLKADSNWKNTLVIISADHGTTRPDGAASFKKTNFGIPIIITGGMIGEHMEINTTVSQLDIPYTLAEPLGVASSFALSQSLFKPSGKAFYSYYDGAAFVSDSCTQFFDLSQQRYLRKQHCASAYEQAFYQKANTLFFRGE